MIREAFQFASADFPVWLLRLVFSVTIVCLSAALANLLLRRFSAAMRHRVWALGVAASLAMPAMILWSPEFRLGWLNVAKPRPVLPPDSPLVADLEPASPAIEFDPRVFEAQGADSNVPPRRATTSGNTSIPRAVPSRGHLPDAVGTSPDSATPRNRIVAAAATQSPSVSRIDPNTFWLLVLVVPAACGIWQSVRSARAVRRVVNDARLVQDAATLELVADVCRRLQWNGVLDLRQSSRTPIPLCVGWKRPCILLPPEWRSWGEMTLRAVLAHEVSHIVRRDVAWQMVARVACYLYWFHPLVWLAARKMRVERETACDDSVLAIVDRPVDYASVLLRFAREMVAHRTPAAALPMSSFSGLEGRVRAILDKSRPRSPVGPRVSRLCALAAILVTACAASLSPLSRDLSGVVAADDGNAWKKPQAISPTALAAVTGGQIKTELPAADELRRPNPMQPILQAQSGEISGHVALKSESKKGLARAKILGIPENPKASYLTAVADGRGDFHVPRIRSAMLFLAQNDDRTLSGIARIEPQESGVVIPVGPLVSARGRLLDASTGQPLGSWPIEYRLVLDGSFLDEFHVSQTNDAKRLLGGLSSTLPNGQFFLPGLAPGWTYRISCCPSTVVNGVMQMPMINGRPQPFITLNTFTPGQSKINDLGDIKRPRPESTEDFLPGETLPLEHIENVLESKLTRARLADQRVLIVAGSPKNEIFRAVRTIVTATTLASWAPGGDTRPAAPQWAADPALHNEFLNYSEAVLGLEVQRPGATTRTFLEHHKLAMPTADDVVLAVLDIDGHLIAEIGGQQLFAGKPAAAGPLSQWLHEQAPKMPDAKKLYDEALAQAKRENKRVLLRENGREVAAPECLPCYRLGRYLEQYKGLIEKDYVCLKIDLRFANAEAVINRVRDYDLGGYPWMVILDANGKPLVSSTSPHGNIGSPESRQEASYFAWMLRVTSQHLSEEEIATLVSALAGDNQ